MVKFCPDYIGVQKAVTSYESIIAMDKICDREDFFLALAHLHTRTQEQG